MQKIIFSLLITMGSLSIHAQQVWKDYIIGRPMAGYFDAKKETAQAWGIRYQAVLGGCVISDKMDKEAAECKANNERYFKQLEAKFGKDWKKEFDLDVKKAINLKKAADEKRVWIEPIMGRPNMQHFEAKKIVAKTWGIHYEAKFFGCTPSDSDKEGLEEAMEQSNAYQRYLNSHFGDNWKETFAKEIALQEAKQNAPIVPQAESPESSAEIWIEYADDPVYINTKKAIAQKWGIQYAARSVGLSKNKQLAKEKKRVQSNNDKYFKTLDERYGNDWKAHFERAVQKELSKQLLKEQMHLEKKL